MDQHAPPLGGEQVDIGGECQVRRADLAINGDTLIQIVDRHRAHGVHAKIAQLEPQPRSVGEQFAPGIPHRIEPDEALATRMYTDDFLILRPHCHHGAEIGPLEGTIERGLGLFRRGQLHAFGVTVTPVWDAAIAAWTRSGVSCIMQLKCCKGQILL